MIEKFKCCFSAYTHIHTCVCVFIVTNITSIIRIFPMSLKIVTTHIFHSCVIFHNKGPYDTLTNVSLVRHRRSFTFSF